MNCTLGLLGPLLTASALACAAPAHKSHGVNSISMHRQTTEHIGVFTIGLPAGQGERIGCQITNIAVEGYLLIFVRNAGAVPAIDMSVAIPVAATWRCELNENDEIDVAGTQPAMSYVVVMQ